MFFSGLNDAVRKKVCALKTFKSIFFSFEIKSLACRSIYFHLVKKLCNFNISQSSQQPLGEAEDLSLLELASQGKEPTLYETLLLLWKKQQLIREKKAGI